MRLRRINIPEGAQLEGVLGLVGPSPDINPLASPRVHLAYPDTYLQFSSSRWISRFFRMHAAILKVLPPDAFRRLGYGSGAFNKFGSARLTPLSSLWL